MILGKMTKDQTNDECHSQVDDQILYTGEVTRLMIKLSAS
jgi:hypothetical protein